MKRSIIIAAILAFSSSAWAQTTETFNNFVNGLPVASTFGSGDQMYVRQGGLSKQILGSTVQSGTFTGLFTGTLPFVQANNYNAGSSGSIINAVRGVNGTPNQNTDGVATAIIQSTTNFNGTAPALYVSTRKQGLQGQMSGAYGIAIWAEAVDNTGGGSLSGARFTGTCVGGTGGNCTGNVNVGIASVPYAYVIGAENQVWNVTGTDANTTFSSASFAAGEMSTSSGTNKIDAFFLANPNGVSTGIWGILFPAGTVDASGSVLKSAATTTYGVDLRTATTTTAAWAGPSSTSLITGAGEGYFAAGALLGSSPPTASTGQIGYGGTTVAAGSGTCPTGTVGGSTVQGCIVVNIAGTSRNVPFF